MPGTGVLLLLFFISSIPVVIVFFWFRLGRYPFTFPHFAASLFAGAAAFFPALFLQYIFAAGEGIFSVMTGKWGLLAEIFVRIALTEEFSRLVALLLLFLFIRRFVSAGSGENGDAAAWAGAAGLVAGFGFAILESTVKSAAYPGNAILLVFTATPLHGACGARIGVSLSMFSKSPVRAVFHFFVAVVIHGVYNFMLIIPGRLPPIAAVLIALSTLTSSIMAIRSGFRENMPENHAVKK